MAQKRFSREWQKIDSLQQRGEFQSALNLVMEIYQVSKTAGYQDQLIRALLYKISLESRFIEESTQKAIDFVTLELEQASPPVKNVLYSILAEKYWAFYRENSWMINGRTPLADNTSMDMATWDSRKFILTARAYFLLSMENPGWLKTIPLDDFDAVLEKNKTTRQLRPTLYDLLAFRAVDFFSNDRASVIHPTNLFKISEEEYFAPAADFIRLEILAEDTLSFDYNALKLYQDILAFHSGNQKNAAPLVDADLARLEFVYSKSSHPLKDSLYSKALKDLHKRFVGSALSAEIAYPLVLFLRGQGFKYQPLTSSKHQWEVRKALELAESAARDYPETDGGENCAVIAKQIRASMLRLTANYAVSPGFPSLASIEYRNVPELFVRIIKMDPEKARIADRQDASKSLKKWLALKPVHAWSLKLPDDQDYQAHRTEIKIPALKFGYYVVLVSETPGFDQAAEISYAGFWCTDLSLISRDEKDGTRRVMVFDRHTGQPLEDVRVRLVTSTYDYQNEKYTDHYGPAFVSGTDGYVIIRGENYHRFSNYSLELSTRRDRYVTETWFTGGYRIEDVPEREIRTFFFTDRAIYRPGQTVYFKGIVMEKAGETQKVLENHSSTVFFHDVNGQEIASRDFITNSFGSFSGTFTAPQGGLTGQFDIINETGNVSIQVEEYKRPKFEVVFHPVEGSYKLNQEVEVSGMAAAYAGSNLADAAVSFRVVRKARFPYFWWWRDRLPASPEMEIASGTLRTGPDGRFSFRFTAVPDLLVPESMLPVFTYSVYASVTDINGETHSAETSVSAGYKALLISTNLDERISADKEFRLEISATNPGGRPEPAQGTLKVTRLTAPSLVIFERKFPRPDKFTMTRDEFRNTFPFEIYDNEDDMASWERGETVFEGSFATPQDSVIKAFENPGKGYYVIEINTTDAYGSDVRYSQYFSVYSSGPGKTIEVEPLTVQLLQPAAQPGDTVTLLVAVPVKKSKVLVEIFTKNGMVSSQSYDLNDRQINIKIAVAEEHRGNLAIRATMIKNNRTLTKLETLNVPYTHKELDITLGTFRSQLAPGEEEEWQITIRDKAGANVVAEMLATLYDASLDAFIPHFWPFHLYSSLGRIPSWEQDQGFEARQGQINWYRREFGTIREKVYESLIWPEGYHRFMVRGTNMGMVSKQLQFDSETLDTNAEPMMMMAENAPRMADEADETMVLQDGNTTAGEATKEPPVPAKPRKDFKETAFFFPQLATNEKGELQVMFKMPESLTRWRLMGLAHTPDLKTGRLEETLVTRKDLMVFPNVPRFLREGDTMELAVKIANLSPDSLTGKATLQLFDAFTMQPVDELFNLTVQEKEFSAGKDQNAAVSWLIRVPEGLSAIVWRISAFAGAFSDGEEAALPILTNRILVTESLPMPVRGKTTRNFTFGRLADSEKPGSTLRNHRLTLEFTSNPAWYAVQALPYLMEFPHECSEQLFARLYANTLASHIANSSPEIKRVFDSWRTLAPDALKSNLEKNQELKQVLLEETPWVRDAANEQERKQRIALLFDLNRMASEKETALKKLTDNQTVNGGWPWFPGMPESEYITRHIVTGSGRLFHLGVLAKDPENPFLRMATKAVGFLDKKMKDDFRRMKQQDKNYLKNDHLDYSDIQYWYARSFFLQEKPLEQDMEELSTYYMDQAQKFWTGKNNYMKAMIALFLNRMGDSKTALMIMKSLSETALHSDESGMYWRNQPRGWLWYEAPVETHALMIEAFDEVLADSLAVEELKVWLLKQKQTQDWQTTRATTEAVYALLMRGSSLIESGELVSIRVGNQEVNPYLTESSKPEPGTGYFKTSWSAGEISKDMGKIRVENPNNGIAWGAMYWQYFEQADKVTAAQTPLKLSKSLFREINTVTGPVLEAITEDKPIRVGDRVVVRVVLSSDRDMEYVHLKDMRAAAFEPVNVLSGYRWQGGLGYYESTRDAASHFFIDYLPKGTFVFEYKLFASQKGEFSNGITTVQCMYAPEFSAHSEGMRVTVE